MDSPSSPAPSTPGSTTASPSAADAAARREARKARILGKGTDRLAKLTKQARGDQAEELYPSTPPRPAASSTAGTPGVSTPAISTPAGIRSEDDDPEEVDISNQARMDDELARGLELFRARQQQEQMQQQQQGQQGQQDPMQMMMNALMGGMGGPDGAGAGAGASGMPDLSQLFAAINGTGSNMPPQLDADGKPLPAAQGFPPGLFGQQMQAGEMGGLPTKPPSFASLLLSRLLSLLHPLILLFLAYFALSSAFGSSQGDESLLAQGITAENLAPGVVSGEHASGVLGQMRLFKWASLGYFRPSVTDAPWFEVDGSWLGKQGSLVSIWCRSAMQSSISACAFGVLNLPCLLACSLTSHHAQPIFYSVLFLSLTTHLSHLLLVPPKPVAPSLLFSIASSLPIPALRLALRLFSQYAGVVGKVVDDVALLVFALGVGVLYSVWAAGGSVGGG